ncbi:MAG: SPW repeat protein [Trueperaceae bacterium]|nr:SPW repeat protein [Trueperaceae bacterium]
MKRKNNLAKHVRLTMMIFMAIGAWLVLASIALNYGSSGAAISNTIMGLLLVVLAIVGSRSPLESSPICWITGAIGVWLFLSPFVLGYTDQLLVMANNLWMGLFIVILSAFAAGEAQGLEQSLNSH